MIALKERRRVSAVILVEFGWIITVKICMNVAGSFMKTMFIFPKQRLQLEFMWNASSGSTAEFHKSGWT